MGERVLDPAERKKLTFRQAEGLEALPGPLKFLELDRQLRHELWDLIFNFLSLHRRAPSTYYILEGPGLHFVSQIHRFLWRKPIDEAIDHSRVFSDSVKEMKQLILKSNTIDILEAIQVTLRTRGIPNDFKSNLIRVITSERTSYTVIEDTIIPLASPEERDDITANLAEVASSAFSGAYAHLKKAGIELTAGNNCDAIREAIHAVESATIHVTGNKKATLGDALAQIQKTSPIHSTMKAAFEKLYAYTNAEKGIRHALLDSENERVGREEALFMFSACTAFVAYLVRRALPRIPVRNGHAGL